MIAAGVVVGLLTLARPVVLPLLFALVISMALHPVVRRLARVGLPPSIGAALVVALIAGAGWLSIGAASDPRRAAEAGAGP